MSKPIEASIVVVDDEPSIRELLVASLHFAGFEVNTAASGSEAIEVIEKIQPDLIVLDVMLPDIDGFTVTRRIRQEGITTPVLYLTARDDTQDKVMGLTVGGDDYVTKPFSMRELIARCKALLRRVDRAKVIAKNSENEKLLDFGSLVIDPAQRIVTVNGKQVHLTPTEFDLLATLARKPKSVLTREKLLEEVWDWVDASGTRTVDSHVKALRHKLGSKTIRTVHGVGYAFEPPEVQD